MPDDTQTAIDQLKALPKDRQAAILSQLDPAKKQEILTRLSSPPQTTRQKIDEFLGSAEGSTAGRVARGVARVPVGLAETAWDVSQPPKTTAEKVINLVAPGAGVPLKRAVIDPAIEMGKKALESFQKGHISEGAGYTGAAALPLAGPWAASLGERAGAGDIAGAGAELATGLALPKIVEKGAPAVADFAREHSTKIDTRYFGDRESGSAVSKAKLVGSLKSLATQVDPETGVTKPGLIRQELEATKQKANQAIQQATQQGQTVDFSSELDGMTKQAMDVAATRDIQTYRKTAQQIKAINLMVRAAVDPMTKSLKPMNIKGLTPSDIAGYDMNGNATGILKRLESPSFEGGTTQIAENYAKNLRMALSDKLDDVTPGIKDLRRQSHNLISADNAAMKMQADAFAGAKRYMHSIWSKGPIDAGAFVLMHKLLGLDFYSSAGSIVAARAIWDSAPSATTRAAAWRIVSDLLDGKKRARGALQPPGGTAAGGGPSLPAGGPQGAGNGPFNGGFQPPQVTVNKGLSGPTSASQPSTATQITKPQLALPASEALGKQTPATPEVTKIPEGQSGASPKMKAMMDRMDALQEKLDNAKSGQERTAASREIEQLKKIISGESTGVEEKRLAGRERTQRFRAKNAAQVSPDAPEMQGGEAVAAGGTPEQTLSAIQQGYAHLKTLSNGAALAKAFQTNAKKMNLDPSQELDGIIEAIQFFQKNKEAQ